MPPNSEVIESLVQSIVEAVHPLKIILLGVDSILRNKFIIF